MTEEERLAHVKEVSTYKYLPSNFQKKTSSIMSGPPPPTYVCNRCSQSGHWYKNCPMVTVILYLHFYVISLNIRRKDLLFYMYTFVH
ncbi:unnamed protein product [Brugia timori]|uniref:CCHC-type domain-containing protein n=1 Tax=Brugia timori TaxID=42155 RepID=A0A0R3Q7V0_9BILA|nr:unnamed protein product [Brugia timori]